MLALSAYAHQLKILLDFIDVAHRFAQAIAVPPSTLSPHDGNF
jgi:hypothetical protein